MREYGRSKNLHFPELPDHRHNVQALGHHRATQVEDVNIRPEFVVLTFIVSVSLRFVAKSDYLPHVVLDVVHERKFKQLVLPSLIHYVVDVLLFDASLLYVHVKITVAQQLFPP